MACMKCEIFSPTDSTAPMLNTLSASPPAPPQRTPPATPTPPAPWQRTSSSAERRHRRAPLCNKNNILIDLYNILLGL
ncbi:hypothetical protein CDAR_299471 [Caerostris darwini]|uniref:Uncharacterized protein n=1 Tax=Caerostris darwini TaxID=1538125 RepID=A0AAV4RPK1_9ARAC|nr:hypothetical protein CDAR_299471 [Caerostris darwini]